MGEVKVSNSIVGDLIIVCFEFDENSYYLSSPCIVDGSLESELYECFAKATEKHTNNHPNVGQKIVWDTEVARDVWNDLISEGYQRVFQLEDIQEGIERDNSVNTYKIRKKGSNLYSSGGSKVMWKKNLGKTWNKLSHLKSHLTSNKIFIKKYNNMAKKEITIKNKDTYDDCEIVEYGEINSVDIFDIDKLKKKL